MTHILSKHNWARIGLGAVALCTLGSRPVAAAPAVGQTAPALIGPQMDGQPFDLAACKGKVVVVHFWATWCPPCRAEMPLLSAFYTAHKGDVLVIGESVDDRHDRKAVAKVMRTFSFPAALLCDAKANGFGDIDSLPATYIVDGQGVIRAIFRGGRPALTNESLEAAVLPLLPKPAPAK